MKKQFLIYADESYRKGKYFSNFYGGALVKSCNFTVYGYYTRINEF